VSRNPHHVPLDKIVWHKRTSPWEFPLKAVIGESVIWQSRDGRRFIRIAELYNPTKCTYESSPDNFHPICDTAKRILLGELKAGEE
jgi:hypothetical protein